jgi:hypothetical protein
MGLCDVSALIVRVTAPAVLVQSLDNPIPGREAPMMTLFTFLFVQPWRNQTYYN